MIEQFCKGAARMHADLLQLASTPDMPLWLRLPDEALALLRCDPITLEASAKLAFYMAQYLSAVAEQQLSRARVVLNVEKQLPHKGGKLLLVELSNHDFLESVFSVTNCMVSMLTLFLMQDAGPEAARARFWVGLLCGLGQDVQTGMRLGKAEHNMPRATLAMQRCRALFKDKFSETRMLQLHRRLNCDYSMVSTVMALLTVDDRRRAPGANVEVLRTAIARGEFLADLLLTSVAFSSRKQTGWRMKLLRWCWMALIGTAVELRCRLDLPPEVMEGIRSGLRLPESWGCSMCGGSAPPVGPCDAACKPLCHSCGQGAKDVVGYITDHAFP